MSTKSGMRRRGPAQAAGAALVTAAVLVAGTAGAGATNPTSGSTTTGQTLTVQITGPAAGSTVATGSAVTVDGVANFTGGHADAAVVYVVDASGSTTVTAGDCNGDGVADTADRIHPGSGSTSGGDVLDCELSGVLALNASLSPSVDAGLVYFSSAADVLDVDPTAATATFTGTHADVDGNGRLDIDDTVRATNPAFGNTNFNAALEAAGTAFGSSSAATKVAYFLSDGIGSVSTTSGSPLDRLAAAGTVVNTYSVGPDATGCGPGSGLRVIADTTGGLCVEVADPTDLRTGIVTGPVAGLDHVELALNGGAPVAATTDALGNFTGSVGPILAGSNTIVATGVADDGTRVSSDITVVGGAGGPGGPGTSGPRLVADPLVLTVKIGGSLFRLSIQVQFHAAVRLVDGAGAPMAGKPVVFSAPGGPNLCTARTDGNGRATCLTLLSPGFVQAALALGYDARFPGDATAGPAAGHGPLANLNGFALG